MRKRIYQMIEIAEENDTLSSIYDIFMMVVIIASLISLTIKEGSDILNLIDYITVAIFIADYVLRLATADFKLRKGSKSFLLYPMTPMALIDLLSILPSLTVLNSGFRVLKIFRLIRTFRVFRVFKAVRYSKNMACIPASY